MSSDEDGQVETTPQVDTWCICGKCEDVAKTTEAVCCHTSGASKLLSQAVSIYKEDAPYQCIIEHPSFKLNCLAPEVIVESWKGYKHFYGDKCCEGPVHKRNRHVAYSNAVRLFYNIVGRNCRIVLPSCVVAAITAEFPAPDSSYTGYLPPWLE